MNQADPNQEAPRSENESLQKAQSLDRRGWRNWFLFIGVTLLTLLGLAMAVVTLLGGRVRSLWPWANTDLILLAGLALAVLLFAGYLTQQQRQVVGLRLQLLRTNQETSERVRRHYDRLVALLNVSRVLSLSTKPKEVFDTITRTCMETFECQQASLMLLNGQTRELEVCSVSGQDCGATASTTTQKVDQGIIGWVAAKRRPLLLRRDLSLLGTECNVSGPLPVAAMVVPFTLRGELVGVLSVSSSVAGTLYTDEDLQALQVFAETAGTCCRHAEQTDWMRQTIQRLDAALQERDAETRGRAA